MTIAEIGSSHNGNYDTALRLIDCAAEAGADYAKFQLFSGDDLWLSTDPRCETTRKLSVPEDWIPKLYQHCFDRSITFLCTPFSVHAVEVLRSIGVTSYKIASGDLTFTPLLQAVGQTNRPVFLSVGASTFSEIDTALSYLEHSDVILLHCVPEYPATPDTANIRRILDLSELYMLGLGDRVIPIGLSSHLREWWVDVAAVPFHPYVIEKHLDLEGRPGPEGGHSLDPAEFRQFVKAVRDVGSAMVAHKTFTEGELYARSQYRRNPSDWLRPLNRD
jgi:sialic acid synthase SpsE